MRSMVEGSSSGIGRLTPPPPFGWSPSPSKLGEDSSHPPLHHADEVPAVELAGEVEAEGLLHLRRAG